MLTEFTSWVTEHLVITESQLMLVFFTGFLSYLAYLQTLDICRMGCWTLLPRLLAMLGCVHLVASHDVPGGVQLVTAQYFVLTYLDNAENLYT